MMYAVAAVSAHSCLCLAFTRLIVVQLVQGQAVNTTLGLALFSNRWLAAAVVKSCSHCAQRWTIQMLNSAHSCAQAQMPMAVAKDT